MHVSSRIVNLYQKQYLFGLPKIHIFLNLFWLASLGFYLHFLRKTYLCLHDSRSFPYALLEISDECSVSVFMFKSQLLPLVFWQDNGNHWSFKTANGSSETAPRATWGIPRNTPPWSLNLEYLRMFAILFFMSKTYFYYNCKWFFKIWTFCSSEDSTFVLTSLRMSLIYVMISA